MFDVAGCRAAAEAGRLDEWVHRYLRGGPWANEGLSTGLALQTRHWTGPVLLQLNAMERCCGPELQMEYQEDVEVWCRTVRGMAAQLPGPMQLPPLIQGCSTLTNGGE